jgi:hypothetical protein
VLEAGSPDKKWCQHSVRQRKGQHSVTVRIFVAAVPLQLQIHIGIAHYDSLFHIIPQLRDDELQEEPATHPAESS